MLTVLNSSEQSPAGRRYRQMCHMLCQKGQSQDSSVINTDFNINYLLSDLESKDTDLQKPRQK